MVEALESRMGPAPGPPPSQRLRLSPFREIAERSSRFTDAVFTARLIGLVALAALLLALAGVVAVTHEAVRANVRDLGVRSALGASASSLVRLVLRHTLTRTAAGLAAGLVIPFVYWSRQDFRELGSSATVLSNPLIYSVLLAAVAAVVAGSYWPARAAGRLDPAAVMRQE